MREHVHIIRKTMTIAYTVSFIHTATIQFKTYCVSWL